MSRVAQSSASAELLVPERSENELDVTGGAISTSL